MRQKYTLATGALQPQPSESRGRQAGRLSAVPNFRPTLRVHSYTPEKAIFEQTITFFCMSTKFTKTETTPAAKQPETAREALHRRVKQAQERRRHKLKHVNP